MSLNERLRGEPDLPDPQDAAAWAEVYEQIVGATRDALERCREHLPTMSPAARHYVERNNIDLLVNELEILERRRAVLLERAGARMGE
jgi:hypothetical protein